MLSRFFIFRPIFASVIAFLTLIGGMVALPLLPIEQYPEITPPTVRVSVRYPGADAITLAETVTAPLEQAINGVEGMIYMKSTSSDDGSVNIDVTFELGTDADLAAVRVQNNVNIAEARLPEAVRRQGIEVIKRSPSLLIVMSLVSDLDDDGEPIYDYAFLSNYATLRVIDPIARTPGVGEATLFGPRDYSMRIWLDPQKMRARDLTTVDVLEQLRNQNVQLAAGRLGDQPTGDEAGFTYTLTSAGRLSEVEEFEDIIVRTGEDQRVVRVKDIGRVELGSELYGSTARRNGQPGAQIPVYQLPGSNSVETAAAVKEVVDGLSAEFPPGLRHEVTFDFTKFVEASIEEVIFTLLLASGLVVLVVFVFLQDWRATLVPAVTIPVALVGTLGALLVMGFSLNLLTLFGLVLAIGIVVDDAIVVVENCARKIEETGCCAEDAATDAMKEITGPIVATTLVVLAVFVPAALLPGLTGQLYRQFAVTLSVATVFSSINALTLSPALCALLLRPSKASEEAHARREESEESESGEGAEEQGEQREPGSDAPDGEEPGGEASGDPESTSPDRGGVLGYVFRPFNWAFDHATTGYTAVVAKAIAFWPVSLIVYAALAVATYFAVTLTPTGFLPEEDQGYFFINVQLPESAKLDRTDAVLRRVEDIVLDAPGVESSIAVAGFSLLAGVNAPNAALCVVILDNWQERPEWPAQRLVEELGPVLGGIPDASVFAFNPPAIRGLGQAGGFEMQIRDQGELGIEVLQQATDAFIAAVGEDPLLGRVLTTFNAASPQQKISIDREQHIKLGIAPEVVNDTLSTMLGSAYVNDFNYFGRVYRVYAQADTPYRQTEGDLLNLQVRNAEGTMTPLDSFVTLEPVVGPQNVVRYNLATSSTINGGGAPGVSSGQVLTAVEKVAGEVLPAGMNFEWTGVTYQQEKAGNTAPIVFALAVLVVFLVLAAQYESWSIPLAILLAVPLGVLGAMIGLLTRGMANDIYAQIGLVLLVALVAKNAILLVEFAVQKKNEGDDTVDAAVDAARLRFRPILMTAFSFVLGTAPLMIASGAGATSRQTLGTAVVVGMTFATAVGLLMTPVFYTVIEMAKDKLGRGGDADPSSSS